MSMKRYTLLKHIFLIIWILINFISQAQETNNLEVLGEPDNDDYPDITFELKHRYPEKLKKDAFQLFEDSKSINFEFKHLGSNKADKNKTILIIWEDMVHNSHAGQKQFYRYILNQSLPLIINKGDKIQIAAFDRIRDGQSVLRRLLAEGYTDNTTDILDAVNAYKSKNDSWSQKKGSDLYHAINEGLNDLIDNHLDENPVLVVFSAGYNNEYSNEKTYERSIRLAREKNIPIYSIQYFVWEHRLLTSLATDTYGQDIFTNNKDLAKDAFIEYMNNALVRMQGQNYEFSFTSSAPADGDAHYIELKAKNAPNKIKIPFNATFNIFQFFKSNPITAFLTLFVIVLIVIIVYMQIKKVKQKQEAIKHEFEEKSSKMSANIINLEQDKERAQQDIKQQKSEIERIRSENRQKEQQAEAERRKKDEAERQKAVFEMMLRNGRLPYLIYNDNGNNKKYEINKPEIIFGREHPSHYLINEKTVSSSHFKISFHTSDRNYYIQDLGSSNKTILNGQVVQQSTIITNGSHIQAGKAEFMFYF